jgi:hypothetical protein
VADLEAVEKSSRVDNFHNASEHTKVIFKTGDKHRSQQEKPPRKAVSVTICSAWVRVSLCHGENAAAYVPPALSRDCNVPCHCARGNSRCNLGIGVHGELGSRNAAKHDLVGLRQAHSSNGDGRPDWAAGRREAQELRLDPKYLVARQHSAGSSDCHRTRGRTIRDCGRQIGA